MFQILEIPINTETFVIVVKGFEIIPKVENNSGCSGYYDEDKIFQIKMVYK